jgi:flagellar protein FlgJ
MSTGSIAAGVLTPNLSGSTLSANSKDSPEKIKEAASQFEALLIGEVLKTVHEGDGGGWMGTGDDQTSSSAMGLADQYLAQSMSKSGGFGLARTVAEGIERRRAKE